MIVGYAKNPRRAIIKIAIIVVVLASLFGIAAFTLTIPSLNQLKFDLSLRALIIIVVSINVISAIAIALLIAAYQWVRRDLKAPRSEDQPDLPD